MTEATQQQQQQQQQACEGARQANGELRIEVTGGVDEPTVPACAKFLRIQGEWGRRSEKLEPSDEGGEVKEMT